MEVDSLPTVDLDALTAILGDEEPEEDLWAKLELPTPPLSPDSSGTGSGEDFEQDDVVKPTQEEECNIVDWHSDCESETETEFGQFRNPYLRRDVKHDCMWSGSCMGSAQCFRRTSQLPTAAALPVVSVKSDAYLFKSDATWSSTNNRGRPRRARSVSESSSSSSCSSSDSSASEQSFVAPFWPSAEQQQQQSGGVFNNNNNNSGEQTSHAPYPHSDHSYHAGCQDGGPPRDSLGIQTPSDSEEEIDVVTLPDKRIKTEASKPNHKRTGVSPSLPYERQLQLAVVQAAQRQQRPNTVANASDKKPGTERLHRRRRNQGLRLTLKRVRPLTRGNKRLKTEAEDKRTHYHITTTPNKPSVNRSVLQSTGPLRLNSLDASCGSSSAGSEEDTGRRKEHNDMERKRRNDLKGSFQILRRQVPELAHNERAPKVQILTRASNYIEQLVSTEKRLLHTKDSQQHRNAQLRRQLSALQRKRSYAN